MKTVGRYFWHMINSIRNSFLLRLLWGIMGFYLLNISVDTNDLQPDNIAEDLSFNDQESLVEIMVEQILGFEDAFKEYDDVDPEDHNSQNQKTLDLIYHNSKNPLELIHSTELLSVLPKFDPFLSMGIYTVDTPPPKI